MATGYGVLSLFKNATAPARAAAAGDGGRLHVRTSVEIATIVDQLRRRFAGQEVPWVSSKAMRGVREHLLEHTAVCPRDLSAVQHELGARGWRLGGRRRVFSFPKS